jgi:hypothetical protein
VLWEGLYCVRSKGASECFNGLLQWISEFGLLRRRVRMRRNGVAK